MELRQLQYFVAVAEDASFTKAAAKVHVAQSGVSAQVRRLEAELGQSLFDRSSRAVRLTEVGAAVLPHARAALEAVAGARLAVDELTGLVRGHVAVGMVVACGALDLPPLLADFHRAHPGVEITLSEANSDRLLEALQGGELDMAVVALAGAPPPGIETQVIIDEALVAAVHPADPLASRSSITLHALMERELISLPLGTGMRTCLEDACTAAGLRAHVAFEASAPTMLAELAQRGLGVAILPESLGRSRPAELHALTIIRPRLRGRIELAWSEQAGISPAARALKDHARAALG
jgi:DNA-binding transcriptional LysR family regulator